MVFEGVTRVPIMQIRRIFPVDRQMLASAPAALSRLKYKVSHPRIFDRIIPCSPGNFKQHKVKRNHQTGTNRFSYSDALRRNWHEWHHRDWWRQHCNNIVFVTGGYYFLDASYWYPAYGYDPLNSYYDYDGPIYTYGNLLPDQVIANVQAALQDAGYYFGSVTGSLSVETRAALANFQRDQGLIVTGAIDEPTVAALGLY
jgi:hypothetical protein